MAQNTNSFYPFLQIEMSWQNRWDQSGVFNQERDTLRPKWFVMELPPFANGKLHMGHIRNYALADASARFRRMTGCDVLYTTGFDSFGLPNEITAIEEGCHPRLLAEKYMAEMRTQFKRFGFSHDQRRIMGYHEPEYYRWVQWVFLRLFKEDLAFRRKGTVNWCPNCACSLAESLVENGQCWRCRTTIEARETEQWFVRESCFADALLDGIPALTGWPEVVKKIHIDWIGKRLGCEVRFTIAPDLDIPAFIDDPCLLPGAAFIVISRSHPVLDRLMLQPNLAEAIRMKLAEIGGNAPPDSRRDDRAGYCRAIALGIETHNPLDGRSIPLIVVDDDDPLVSDGAVVGIPGHIRRDQRLAVSLGIPHLCVLQPPAAEVSTPFDWKPTWLVVNSGPYDGTTAAEAAVRISAALSAKGACCSVARYRLRDWNIARQRYWGPPVPIIHCPQCGLVPVPDDQLPVLLPDEVDLREQGNPLEHNRLFQETECPQCRSAARRDTDTLEAYSSPWWMYWLCKDWSTDNPFDPESAAKWMPVDLMVGGIDQARSCFFHLRMVARALAEQGIIGEMEPVTNLMAIGMVQIDGQKMSKSLGNRVDIGELTERFGADSIRFGILTAASPDQNFNWTEDVVRSASQLLTRVWHFTIRQTGLPLLDTAPLEIQTGKALRRKLADWVATAVYKTTGQMERNSYHLAGRNIRFLFDRLEQFEREAPKTKMQMDEFDIRALAFGIQTLLKLLSPFAPHLAEELWSRTGGVGFISTASWPGSQEPIQ